MSIKPVDDRLLVRPVESEKVTSSGLIIPDQAQEKPVWATVLEVGPKVPEEVVKGMQVLHSKWGGSDIEVDGEKLMMLRYSDLLATRE